tara:strand:- start:2978 stop:3277 length:300 start_codon:yes stop_codon:yes gene_type:complete
LISSSHAPPLVFTLSDAEISFHLVDVIGDVIDSSIPILSASVFAVLLPSTSEEATISSARNNKSLYSFLSFANSPHSLVSIISSILVFKKFTQSANALY